MSDKITPATDEQVAEMKSTVLIEKRLAGMIAHPSLTQQQALSLIARITALTAEIATANELNQKLQQDYLDEANKLDHARTEIARLTAENENLRSHTAPRELVDEPEAWIIEHTFTDCNGDRADAQIFCYREEAEDKRQDLITLWLDEQPESVTEAPDDLYPIIPLYRSALSGVAKVECEWNTDNYPYWTVSCMKVAPSTAFIEISTVIDEFKFCPYCGKSIKLKEKGETEARHGKD